MKDFRSKLEEIILAIAFPNQLSGYFDRGNYTQSEIIDSLNRIKVPHLKKACTAIITLIDKEIIGENELINNRASNPAINLREIVRNQLRKEQRTNLGIKGDKR